MHVRSSSVAITMTLLFACGGNDAAGREVPGDPDASSPSSAPDGSVAACSASDLSSCDYPGHALKSTEREGFTVDEKITGRVLPMLARIPEGAGPFPVVLWSHGGGFNDGGHRLSQEWGTALAGQGYVVLHPAHVALTAAGGKAVCDLASIPAAECTLDAADEDSPVIGMVKGLDLIAVLDRLEALSKESVARGGPALDLARVATAGWSGGSRGPLMLHGTKVKTTASAPLYSRPDARVVASVGLSPAGPGFGGYFDGGAETSWTAVRGPFLIATGQNDVKPNKPELTGPIRRFAFSAQPADGRRRLLYSNLPVGVGGHGTYNLEDSGSSDERLSRFSRALRSTVLAFLDAHVKGDAAAEAWLATDNARVLAGEADWERR